MCATQVQNSPRTGRLGSLLNRPLSHSVIVHGLHKSATMFLFEFFQTVSADRKVPFYSDNLPDPIRPPTDGSIHCESPVRTFDFEERNQDTAPTKRIFHIRDPRDMLVSEYFSVGWIHPNETGKAMDQRRSKIQKMTVDEYVLQQPEFSSWPLNEKFKNLLSLDLSNPNYSLVRYEDMVLDFPSWARTAIEPFEFRFPGRALNRYVKKFSSQFEVKQESMSHRRKVTPGDHKEKLQPSTIEALNDRFQEVLTRFGYQA